MPRPHDGTTCETLAVRIEALVDGELEAAEKASLTRHFAVCPDCARQYRLALAIRHELQAMPELDAPAHLLDSAVELSRQQPSSRGSWTRYLQLPRPAWIALGAAAAVLLSILVLVLETQVARPVETLGVTTLLDLDEGLGGALGIPVIPVHDLIPGDT